MHVGRGNNKGKGLQIGFKISIEKNKNIAGAGLLVSSAGI